VSILRSIVATVCLLAVAAGSAGAQADVRIRDLTNPEGTVPVRLVGYGLVVGLDGTGDRAIGGQSAGQTVQSVVNILRRFNIEVPADLLRMRNVAAVLVTAEVSPFLRAGGRFEVQVSSMGDARSLRGGVLYMSPMVSDPSGPAVATAQGALLVSEGGASSRYAPTIETSARIPTGGVLEADLPRPWWRRPPAWCSASRTSAPRRASRPPSTAPSASAPRPSRTRGASSSRSPIRSPAPPPTPASASCPCAPTAPRGS
jgi:flagellar P-ring protein precursor FlgI